MPEKPPTRARRSDHLRNREALLDAARAVFAEHGADASVEEIVQRAGFAKGTFFRHFANKQVLVGALLADRLRRLGEIARDTNAAHEPGWSTLSLMMERMFDQVAGDRSLAEFMDRKLIELTDEMSRARQELAEQLDTAVSGAQAKGEVRGDVSGNDFPAVLMMITRATARSHASYPGLGLRYLRLFLDGVRDPGSSDLGAPPLSLADLDAIRHSTG